MNKEALRVFVADIVKQKDLKGIDNEIKNQVTEDLVKRLEEQILRALISELSEPQLSEFEKLVDESNEEKLNTFFEDCNLPVKEIIIQTMTRFKRSYLSV